MKVEVTATDVERGEPGDCENCPIALALERQTGKPWFVAPDYARPLKGPLTAARLLPAEALDWIRRFDAGEPVEPFTFDLPEEATA